MQPIEQLTETEALGDQRFEWDVPDGWQQGRGAFGGLVLCAVLRTLEKTVEDPDLTLRTVSSTLCGPVVVGPATLIIRELRRGSNTLTTTCDVVQEGDVRAHVTAFYGKRRVEDGDWSTVEPPEMPAWREMDPLPIGPPMGPVFAQNMEMRSHGPFPFSSGETREATGWVRPKVPTTLTGEPYLALLADTFWPSFFATLDTPRPAATVGFTMEFFGTLADSEPNEPVFYRASAPVSAGGYMLENREIWSADGRLLGVNHQTFCIIK